MTAHKILQNIIWKSEQKFSLETSFITYKYMLTFLDLDIVMPLLLHES